MDKMTWNVKFFQVIGVIWVMLINGYPLAPMYALLRTVNHYYGCSFDLSGKLLKLNSKKLMVQIGDQFCQWVTAATIPAAYLVYLLSGLFLTLITKWLVLGKLKEGNYPVWSWYFLRWWLVRLAIDRNNARLAVLKHTPLITWWYRLLGAKIGNGVVIDTTLITEPDLVAIGDNSVLCDISSIQCHIFENGVLRVGKVAIGSDCVLGTGSVILAGASMGNGSATKPLTLIAPMTDLLPNTLWEGSPAVQIPGATKPLIHESKVQRFFVFLFQMISLLFIAIMDSVPLFTIYVTNSYLFITIGVIGAVCLIPVVLVVSAIFHLVFVVIVKWILIGKVKPRTYSLHGSYFLRRWIVERLLMSPASVMLTSHFITTNIGIWFYRALGSKIGTRTVLPSIFLPPIAEANLFTMKDNTFVGSTYVSCSIFEDGKYQVLNYLFHLITLFLDWYCHFRRRFFCCK